MPQPKRGQRGRPPGMKSEPDKPQAEDKADSFLNAKVDVKAADQLQELMEKEQSLTTQHEQGVQNVIALWAALREGDRAKLKAEVGWTPKRDYVVDPLPARISEAFADLLFGEDPHFIAAETAEQQALEEATMEAESEVKDPADPTADPTADPAADPSKPADPAKPDPSAKPDEGLGDEEAGGLTGPVGDEDTDGSDQERLDAIIEANNMASELRAAAEICSSEGEVWWRLYTDAAQSDYPIIEWHSRSHVRPLFRGRKLQAAAFVSELWAEKVADEWTVYRYVEIHAEGYSRNVLYRGDAMRLGSEVDLGQRPETDMLQKEWAHGMPMMCGRIPNKLGRDRRYGISDYHGVRDLLLSLNEATTIGHENARLTLKRRVVVPREALSEDGQFDASEDVLIADSESLDESLDNTGKSNKYTVLEYSFDAQALIAYKDNLASIILTRVGLAQQFVNPNSGDGAALSGTALRVRLIPTTLAAKGKGRPWDDQVPQIIMLAQMVDSLPKEQGGFDRPWHMQAEPPVVERSTPLPEDDVEKVNRHSTAVTAEIESRFTAIQDMHSDWDNEQVQQELDRIDKEAKEFGKGPNPLDQLHKIGAGDSGLPPQFGGSNGNGPDPGVPDPAESA